MDTLSMEIGKKSEIESKLELAEEQARDARKAFQKSTHSKTQAHSERASEIYAGALRRVERLRCQLDIEQNTR